MSVENMRKNRNENAKAGVCRRIARQAQACSLRNRFGIECIGYVVRKSRLHWFGHVERKSEEDWVKKMLTFEAESKRLQGRHM